MLSCWPKPRLPRLLGFEASGWLRTAADTGLISFLLAAWFFISFVGPDLKWPDATLKLSAFYYYGTPLLHGIQFGDIAIVVGLSYVCLLLKWLWAPLVDTLLREAAASLEVKQ